MANPSVVINSVTYSNCPEVDIPKSGGGTAKFYYTGDANAEASHILTGKTAFGASGSVSGNMANNGSTSGEISTKSGTVSIPTGYTSGGTVSIKSSAVTDLTSANLLGVSGSLTVPTVSQDGTTKILSIS